MSDIKFVVVAHHLRRHEANRLASSLHAHVLIDEGWHGANWNHRRAIEWASKQDCRVVIVEDDARPVPCFVRKVTDWLSRFPDEFLSFYLGTGRPPQYQLEIASKLIAADKSQSDFITLNRLIHGVCYSPPPRSLSKILTNWNRAKPADYAVGDAYGGAVIYPCYSLADHAEGDVIEQHPDGQQRTERRKAWRLDISSQ